MIFALLRKVNGLATDCKVAKAPGARATGGFNAVRSMVIFLNYSMD